MPCDPGVCGWKASRALCAFPHYFKIPMTSQHLSFVALRLTNAMEMEVKQHGFISFLHYFHLFL